MINIKQLIDTNPRIKTETCKIRLVNWPMGFGSAMNMLLNNMVYLNKINPNIIIEPLWNNNTDNFKYHDTRYENSFYQYFEDTHPERLKLDVPTYLAISTPHSWAKSKERPMGWGQDEEDIECFKKNFRLNRNIRDFVHNSLANKRPIYGIHLRSNQQKVAHYPNEIYDIEQVCTSIADKHNNEDCYYFVATDTESYLKTALEVFKNNTLYYPDFLRVDHDSKDSIPMIKEKPGLRYGLEILGDAYTLALCDIFYYSKSNVHFLVRCLGNPVPVLY